MALNSGFSEGAFNRLNLREGLRTHTAGGVSRAATTHVTKGYHYVAADYGFVYLGPEIGTVVFRGRPIGPGNTDTIYKRIEDLRLTELGVPETIPVELVALCVGSISPVSIGGVPHDMIIDLTPGTRSLGELSAIQELADDGSGIPHGVFNTNININFTCHFTPVGSDKEAKNLALSSEVYIATIRPGTWSFNPWPHSVVSTHADGPTTNFFLTSSIYMLSNDLMAGGSKVGATL
jgi:hypothetical protein